MAELILLSERMADRSRPARSNRSAFFFELGCPLSYLAAERVERLLGDLDWIATARLAPARCRDEHELRELFERAARQADALRLPLVAPDNFPAEYVRAWRAATYASEQGVGGRFALAASRLAYCGGFDLDEPDVLAEAGAAAGLEADQVVAAARDSRRDAQLFATAKGLVARGVDSSPAIRVGSRWFGGVDPVADAASYVLVRELYGTAG
jgi:2-hydroxychromene-2-carboxylate isomerase